MQYSINRITLIGNITKDPELRYTANGKEMLKFSIATNRSIKKGNEWESYPTFHNIVMWGTDAEKMNEILEKGMPVYVEGRMEHRTYDKDDGSKGYVSEVVADMVMDMVSHKKGKSTAKKAEAIEPDESDEGGEDIAPEEIPF